MLFEWIGSHRPYVQDGDMTLINQPIDFLGVNYYMTYAVRFSHRGGMLKTASDFVSAPNWGHTAMGWGINPPGLITTQLQGKIINDGLGDSKVGKVTIKWTLFKSDRSGGTVTFDDSNALHTKASFSKQGDYILQLKVNNGYLSTSDQVTISVQPPGKNPKSIKFGQAPIYRVASTPI